MHPAVSPHPLFPSTFTFTHPYSLNPLKSTPHPAFTHSRLLPHVCPAPPPCCQFSHNWRGRHFCCSKQVVKPAFPPLPSPPPSRNLPPSQLTLWQHSAYWVTHWSCHRQWVQRICYWALGILILCWVSNVINETSEIEDTTFPLNFSTLIDSDWQLRECKFSEYLTT